MFGSIFIFFARILFLQNQQNGLTKRKTYRIKTIIIHEIPKFQHKTFDSNE